jgi:hypothetical protein
LQVRKVKRFEGLGRSQIFRGQGAWQIWEDMEVGNIFGGQEGRQIWEVRGVDKLLEVREVGKFGKLGK